VLDAARLMGERKIRHLPVLEGENLLGMVGIREVMRTLVERLWRTQDPEARERARELLARHGSALSSDG
jgi:signal-transduction protein with cAMP-binding, CBS, and nucleotidyltransferase domain